MRIGWIHRNGQHACWNMEQALLADSDTITAAAWQECAYQSTRSQHRATGIRPDPRCSGAQQRGLTLHRKARLLYRQIPSNLSAHQPPPRRPTHCFGWAQRIAIIHACRDSVLCNRPSQRSIRCSGHGNPTRVQPSCISTNASSPAHV